MVRRWLLQIGGGIACVGAGSVAIGLTAPRWPRHWLTVDRGPVRLTPLDSRQTWERLGVSWWKRRFPEGGGWAGGESKSRLPRLDDRTAVERYVVETRRAEWVHWLANLSVVPVWFFADAWIAGAFTVITVVVNAIPIMIVRYNRLRLYDVLAGIPG